MNFFIKTLGCKLNQAESEEIAHCLMSFGYSQAKTKEMADFCIVNTCSITEKADRKSRQAVKSLKSGSRSMSVIGTGCSSDVASEVDYFVQDKKSLGEFIKRKFPLLNKIENKFTGIEERSNRKIRAMIKIQDGCDNFCHYCIIPYRRGLPVSMNAEEIIFKINERLAEGSKEIVLTGVNIMKYNFCGFGIEELVKKILAMTSVERIRFGSIDPALVKEEFISLFSSRRVMPHLHLSLQSGSDRVLQLMNRRYGVSHFADIISEFTKKYRHFNFTTDIISGYPGETAGDFAKTVAFLEKINLSKIHSFRYSKRPGTVADKMPEQVPEKIKKERALVIEQLSKKKENAFKRSLLGEESVVLFEGRSVLGWEGFTENYIRYYLISQENLENMIKKVKIKKENIKLL